MVTKVPQKLSIGNMVLARIFLLGTIFLTVISRGT
jgi:hypothetical protein